MNIASGDILDRFSIVKLKMDRATEKPLQEYEAFEKAFKEVKVKYPQFDWDLFLDIAYRTNGLIWDLEGAIRNAQLDDNLMETGKRAIMIRKVNGIRVGIKNLANSLTGEGFVEVKNRDHLSQ
jgi:hypothetical protein